MNGNVEELCITVGYRCNFKCAHCAVVNKRHLELADSEKKLLVRVIKKRRVKALFFVGGEPTLYVPDINAILTALAPRSIRSVKITTNGHFATTVVKAVDVLKQYASLDVVQLSYDNYHAKFLPLRNIKNLYQACRRLDKKFNIVFTIQSPMALVQLRKFRALGDFPVVVQKLHPVGAAKENNLSYSYPCFSRHVLRQRCPNLGKLIYMCGEGFTTCCSYLSLRENTARYIHPSAGGHLRSSFYRLISKNTFGGLMQKLGVSRQGLRPEHSSPCALCDYIFKD